MSTDPTHNFGDPTQFCKISIQGAKVADCSDSDEINGDYILAPQKDDPLLWSVSFPDRCGYTSLSLMFQPAARGKQNVTVEFTGGKNKTTWTAKKVADASQPFEVKLKTVNSKKDIWPKTLTVTPLGTQSKVQTFEIPPAPLSTKAAQSAMSAQSTSCFCQGCGIPIAYKAVVSGVSDDDCIKCTAINGKTGVPILEYDSGNNDFCEYRSDEFTICDIPMEAFVDIGNLGRGCDETDMYFGTGFATIEWRKQNVDCLKTNILDVIDPGVHTICDFGLSKVTITPILPPNPAKFDEVACFNREPCPEAKVSIPLPIIGCEILNLKCGCRCSSGGGGCGCNETYDMQAGQVAIPLDTPSAGSQALVGGVTLLTSPVYATPPTEAGRGTSSLINQKLIKIDDSTASVFHCDGSIIRYKCKDPVTGVYVPVGGSGSLKQLPDGSWVEVYEGITFNYNSSGVLVSAVDQCGLTWTFHSSSPLSYIKDPFNRRTTYSYDGSGNLSGIEDPFGRVSQFEVDANGNLAKFITCELCITNYKYNNSNQLTAVVDPEGNRTSFCYYVGGSGIDEPSGWIKCIERPNGGITTYTYVDYGTTEVTDPKGNVTTLLFDGYRNNTGVINPLGQRTTWVYTRGFVENHITPEGIRTTYTYIDGPNNTILTNAEIRPNGRTTYVYDSEGRLAATVDALSNRTTNIYTTSTSKQLRASVNPLGDRTSYAYDSSGWLTSMQNPLGNRTTYVYDSVGQRIATVNPLLARTSTSYQDGQPVTSENPLGNVSTTLYDSVNRPIATINPLGERTSTLYDAKGRTTATISPTGARTSNVYGVGDQLAATINPLGYRTSYSYDINGNQIRTEDALGNIITTVYDVLNQPVATIDPLGIRSTVVYNADGQQLVTINPLTNRETTVYDNEGRSIANVNPLGARTSTLYDVLNQTIATVNPLGNRTSTVYNANRQAIASIDALGFRTSSVYNQGSQNIASIDALGARNTTIYNAAGAPVASLNPRGARSTSIYNVAGQSITAIDPLGNRSTTLYDSASRPVTTVDPLGNRTTTLYNSNGSQAASIDALGNRTSYIYDLANQQVEITDANGSISTTVYSPIGQVTVSVNALSERSTSIFDDNGRQTGIIDPAGNRSTSVYDSAGNVIAEVNPLGNRISTLYDTANQPVAIENPLGNRTSSIYDLAGQTLATINPLGDRSSTTYDANGQPIEFIDANNHRTTTVYDSLGRQVAEINALSNRATTVYDTVGNQIALVDQNGNRNSFTFDLADRQILQTGPLLRKTTYVYDAAGRQDLRIDARSFRTTYNYDAVDQLVGRRYPDGSRVTFQYDALGNRTLMDDSTGKYTSTYDVLSRPKTVENPDNKRMTYSYNAVNLRSSMVAPDGGRFSYLYNANTQITALVNPQNERTTYAYDSASRRTVKKLANGTRASFSYDAADQQTVVANLKSDSTTISSFQYRYDKAGNRTRVIDESGIRTTWSYDDTNQLTREERSGANSYDNSYVYDPAGNRLVKVETGSRTSTTYDAANQIRYSEDSTGRTTYTFDANGNQEIVETPNNERTTNVWDYENQTTLVKKPDGSRVTYVYNAGNRRVTKSIPLLNTNYLWDASSYLEEYNAVGTTTAAYTSEPTEFGSVVSQRRNTTTSFYHYDVLGSTHQLVDQNENVTDTFLYDAWGNEILRTGTTIIPFRYIGESGYYFDEETNSYYVRARVYQPMIGRWVSRDPLGFIDGLNSYLYANNSPIIFIDFTGNACSPPKGIVSSLRGSWSGYLGKYVPKSWWERVRPRIGSSAGFDWSASPLLFHDGCTCCCEEVGVIQILKSSTAYLNNAPDRQKKSYWSIDDGIPYPHATNANPCDLNIKNIHPGAMSTLKMTDSPNATKSAFLVGLKYLKHDFETCAVCLKGIEGVKENILNIQDPDTHFVQTFKSVTDLMIYSCFKWGHTIRKNTKTGTYIYTRYIGNDRATGGGTTSIHISPVGGRISDGPSDTFKKTVQGMRFVS